MALNPKSQLEESQTKLSAEEPIQFNSLPSLTQKYFFTLLDAVIGVVPHEQRSWIVRTSELHLDSEVLEIVNEVRRWAGRGSKFLNYLQALRQTDINPIKNAYSDARDRDKGRRAYARLRKNRLYSPSETGYPFACFYVASSSNIFLLIKEHLGFGAKETFSLQLFYWAKGIDLKLEFR